jgi:hypothetical protein
MKKLLLLCIMVMSLSLFGSFTNESKCSYVGKVKNMNFQTECIYRCMLGRKKITSSFGDCPPFITLRCTMGKCSVYY